MGTVTTVWLLLSPLCAHLGVTTVTPPWLVSPLSTPPLVDTPLFLASTTESTVESTTGISTASVRLMPSPSPTPSARWPMASPSTTPTPPDIPTTSDTPTMSPLATMDSDMSAMLATSMVKLHQIHVYPDVRTHCLNILWLPLSTIAMNLKYKIRNCRK